MDKQRSIRLTVAFNGDDRLIRAVGAMASVESVYGKLPKDVVGGGRPTALLANIGIKELERSVRLAHEHGLKFYYLLNSACMANEELTRTTNRQIHALLDSIAELGVNGVVVALPYLLSLVKNRYPKLRVSISTFAGIRNAQRARL